MRIFHGAALAVIATLSATAQAQTAAEPVDTDNGDIVVTAQRRSQRLQDVPISVTVQSGDQLTQQGIRSVRDLTLVTPGLYIGGSGPNIQPAIRGISTGNSTPGNDANVAVYLDGVYQPSQAANNFELPDIEQIQVLKGPQGTLFGRNATGGAILVTTKAPSFDGATGSVSASYGRFNDTSIKGYVSSPVAGDTVAASVAGHYDYSSGYYHDVIRGGHDFGTKSYGARGKLLVKAGETVTALFTAAYEHRFDATANAGTAKNGNSLGNAFPGAISPSRPRDVSTNVPGIGVRTRTLNLSAKIDVETDAGTFTSTTGYTNDRIHNIIEGDYTNLNLLQYDIRQPSRTISQELLFTSEKMGILSFVAGAYYYRNVSRYDPLGITGTFGGANFYGRQRAEAISGFAEANFAFTDRLSGIAGARYSYEKRRAAAALATTPGRPLLTDYDSASFKNFTPRVALRYEVADRTNAYVNFSKGFKSGGYNVVGVLPPFDPEKVTAYEGGIKTASRLITANLSGFFYNYKDLQVSVPAGTTNITGNAGVVHIYGLEGDVAIRPVPELTFTAGVAATRARYHRFENVVGNLPVRVGGVPCNCGNTTVIVPNVNGGTLPRSPKLTVSGSIAYVKDIGRGIIDASANVFFSTRVYFEQLDRRDVSQPSYAVFNGRLGYTFPNSGLNLFVYGRNLSNQDVIISTFLNAQADGLSYNEPRNYGVGAKFDF